MYDFFSVLFVVIFLLAWGVIVQVRSLSGKWLCLVVMLLFLWGLAELLDYLYPSAPHYE
ncbi:hypothetical protein [Brevibacillus parabrevis]|uniref:hypothetical protein n=1 Tax=Brevibacillus parabrevis TaxID=54914 RepID=UPI002E1DADF8|nr:hypothetical protein [Brevibacillus parabrevis]